MKPRAKLYDFEALHERNPASSLNLLGTNLTFVGTSANERVEVSKQAGTNNLVVREFGRILGRYNSASVSQITIQTVGGNNVVRIAKDVLQTATINGSLTSHNLFIAGGGATTITGGSGTNKLVGGTGANTIVAGSGNNLIVGGSGGNAINASAGQSHVQRVLPTDTIITNPKTKVSVNIPSSTIAINAANTVLTSKDVENLLSQASMASSSREAIIAVVDRNGRILGVRVEDGVSPNITGNTVNLTFAIDGAVSLARTAAFFSNDRAPLTSRTVGFISQSTVTQREVEGNPDLADKNSVDYGPGFVAPVRTGGHFPPGIPNTPEVDLFGIEHTNRDGLANKSVTLVNGVPSPGGRFNTDPNFATAPIPTPATEPATAKPIAPIMPAYVGETSNYQSTGLDLTTPLSYGVVSGKLPSAQGRGIATLPGGIPIFKNYPGSENGELVGGIGVFFPGKTGYADEENSKLSATYDPNKTDLANEAEYIAFTAVASLLQPKSTDPTKLKSSLSPIPVPFDDAHLQKLRIDLGGITLDVFGEGGEAGLNKVLNLGKTLQKGGDVGTNLPVDAASHTLLNGQPVASGWLVVPHDGVGVTAAQAIAVIQSGINQANQTQAAIRLPLGSSVKMVFAVTDRTGAIVALYRMPDATIFSIDVAVAKARNVNYYDDPTQLAAADRVPGIPLGTDFTNRTFRYLALPRFPSAAEGTPPGPFSILNDPGVDKTNGLSVGPKLPASFYQSVFGYDSFHPGTNFRQTANAVNQNGIVFFPGSTPLYANLAGGPALIGGFGVSGDGVTQDDYVTYGGLKADPTPATVLRADQTTYKGVALPFMNFNRNPSGGL